MTLKAPKKTTAGQGRAKGKATTPAAHKHDEKCAHGQTVADRVEATRKKLRLTPAALAKRSGLAPKALALLLGRLRADPHAAVPPKALRALATGLRVPLQWLAEGDPEAPPKGPTLDAALRERLTFLASQTPTARSLFELERTASLGTELLALSADPGSFNTRRREFSAYEGGPYSSGSMLSGNPGDEDDDSMGLPLAPAPRAETFASNMIRQVISAMSDLAAAQRAPAVPPPPSPFALVTALTAAQSAGLTDVADDLRAQLAALARPAAPSPAPSPAKLPASAKKRRRRPSTSVTA